MSRDFLGEKTKFINFFLRYPKILETLLSELDKYNATAVPPANLPLDPKADPRFWDNVWTNFGDSL